MFEKIGYKSLKNITLMSLAIFFSTLSLSFAQWEPDVRLTTDDNGSYTSYNNAWRIAASEDTFHAVWYDELDTDEEIYYKRSTDAGIYLESNSQPAPDTTDQPPYQVGWPVLLPSNIWNAVSFVNVDAVGNPEVLCASVVSGAVHIKNYDGSNFPGWPVSFGQYNYGAPVAGDVDGDGSMEVFIGANTSGDYAVLYGWNVSGNSLPGFPISFSSNSQVHSGPVLSDINDDGDLEIVFSLYLGDSTYIFNHNGSSLPGWPQASPSNVRDAPVVGDLDGDGDLEVIVAAAYQVYAWHHDGTPYTGFPVSVGSYYTDGLAMGDLDNDGYCEIIVTTVGASNNVQVYKYDGSPLSGWPQTTGSSVYAEPCLGDLDNDGDLEVIVGGTGISTVYHVHAWHHTGMSVNGWPAATAMGEWCQSSAAIGDIDNDGDMEVVIGCDDHRVYAFHHDATPVIDWPISGPADQVSAPITLGDIDLDGDIEVGVGSLDDYIHIWDLSALLEPAHIEWQTYHHDHWFTGWYHPKPPEDLVGNAEGDSVILTWSANSEPDITGYNIYRSEFSGYPYVRLNDVPATDTTYIDTTVLGGNTYYYVVTACIRAGSESRYSAEDTVIVTSVQEITDSDTDLLLWFASLCRGNVSIKFGLREHCYVRLAIYNVLGVETRILVNGRKNSGPHNIIWNGRDNSGRQVPNGIYFIKLLAAEYSETRKLLLVR